MNSAERFVSNTKEPEDTCLRVSTAVMKHHEPKASWAENGFFLFLHLSGHSSSWQELRAQLKAGTWRQELKQRPECC